MVVEEEADFPEAGAYRVEADFPAAVIPAAAAVSAVAEQVEVGNEK